MDSNCNAKLKKYWGTNMQAKITFNQKTQMEKVLLDDGFKKSVFIAEEPIGTSLVRFLNFNVEEIKRMKTNVLNYIIDFSHKEALYDIALRLDILEVFDDNDILGEVIRLLKSNKIDSNFLHGIPSQIYNELGRILPYYSERKCLIELCENLKKECAVLMSENLMIGYALNNTLANQLEYISDEIFECVDCGIGDEMNNSQMPIQIWMNIMLRILEQILFCNEIIYYHEKYTEYANYFCCQGFKTYLDELENKKRVYLYLLNTDDEDEMLYEVEYIDLFKSGRNSREIFVQGNMDFKNLSLEEQVEKIKGYSVEFLECEQLNGIKSWLDSVLTKIIEYNIKLKKCKNCGEYFIPFNRSDAIYCDGPAPKNPKKTCKEFASQNLSYEKLKSDPVRDLHRKVYQQKARRAERNENLKKYAIDFENFKSESKKKKKQMKQGTLTKEEYVEWLKQEKNKEVKVNGNSTKKG